MNMLKGITESRPKSLLKSQINLLIKRRVPLIRAGKNQRRIKEPPIENQESKQLYMFMDVIYDLTVYVTPTKKGVNHLIFANMNIR